MKAIAAAIVLLSALLFLLFVAFVGMARAQARPEPPTIGALQALPEPDFVTLILWCRDSSRRAETPTCRNAELAFERRYAEIVRRNRQRMMDSPLYWIGNPISATTYRRQCDAGYPPVQRWCAPIRAATGG